MRYSIMKLFTAILVISLLIFFGSIYTYAAGSLTLTADQSSYGPHEKVEITVKELDDNQQPITTAGTINVKISRGGVMEQSILQKGLTLVNGAGKFTYITPSKPGDAGILAIDTSNNLSAKLSLQVTENAQPNDWKAESATIIKVKGKVAVQYSGKDTWDSALADSKLHEADTIMTWDKSWATIQLFDGSELTLQPCSTLYIRSLKSSGSNTLVKQSVFKLLTGKVLAKAKQYLEKGSKFEIESESATAGVKGTYFEFGSAINGATQLIVYEGTVFMEQLQDELLYPIPAGQEILLGGGNNPEIGSHSITPDQRDKTLQDAQSSAEPEQTADNGNGQPATDTTGSQGGTDQPKPQPTKSSKLNNVLFGSQMVGDKMYFNLHFQPEFKNILGTGFGLGLDLTLYQGDDKKVYVGGPDGTVSNFINWVEFNGKDLYLRYGSLSGISYDPGLLFSGYTKIKDATDQQDINSNSSMVAKGFQFGLKNIPVKNLGFKVLVPFDVVSFSPWTTEQTSSLYAGRLYYDSKFLGLPLEFGGTYVTDTNPDLKNLVSQRPTSGEAVDCIMPISTLATPYVEASHLNGFGSGAEIGIKGNILSLIQYQGGLRFVTEGFIPNYFGNSYEILKYNSIKILNNNNQNTDNLKELPELSDKTQFGTSNGYYLDANLGLFSWVKLNVKYENYSDMPGYAPLLSGRLDLDVPSLFSLPSISGGFIYQQTQFKTFKSLLNENTSFSWYIKYPINEGVSAMLINTYDPSSGSTNPKYNTSMTMSVNF